MIAVLEGPVVNLLVQALAEILSYGARVETVHLHLFFHKELSTLLPDLR